MQIWVLGTLEVSHDGQAVDVRRSSTRRLLALLALAPGSDTSTDRLVEALWDGRPPVAAEAGLRSHLARLRAELPDPAAVVSGRRGHRLQIDPDDVDAVRFESLVASGTDHLAAGRLEQAGEVLAAALQLWRGTPYAEFGGCGVLEAEAARLEALRLDALECRIAADLGRPGPTPPVAELEALVRWHPARESFWLLLMLALYRCGREDEALAAGRRARAALVCQRGLDRAPGVLELERLVRAHDPSLDRARVSTFLLPAAVPHSYPDQVALVERSHLVESLVALGSEAAAGSGRLVLVHGEAGAGKSALVRAFTQAVPPGTSVLVGACDPLSAPRPLGPLLDVAAQLDPAVVGMLQAGERDGLFELTLDSLEGHAPAVLVVEDLHWADESTLDLVRFLARRLDRSHVLVVATYRDDDLGPSHPLRVMVGDLASLPAVRRLAVPALSREAVARLVGDGSPIDVDALYEETGGNAFFVTEVIASGGAALPPTVQDAVLARVHRLSQHARLALETAAVIGSRIEPSLLHGMPGVSRDSVDECVRAGMLDFDAPRYVFRHELVRQAVLSGIAPGRLGAMHWQALDRLREMPISPPPLSRLAEHAERAGDAAAVLEFAVAAGDAAATWGAHREAAHQYGRAMPYVELLDRDERIDLLRKRGRECHVADELREAIAAWEQAVELLRHTDRVDELGSCLLRLGHTYATIGDSPRSVALVDEAIALLEGREPGADLALGYAYRAGILMTANHFEDSIGWARRALTLADEVGCLDVRVHALNTLGCSVAGLGDLVDGERLVRESLASARDHGLDEATSRAYTNLAYVLSVAHRTEDCLLALDDGIRFMAEHDQHTSMLCTMASFATACLEAGDWQRAEATAHELLFVRETSRASRMEPLVVLATLGARRGDRDDVWALLDEARAQAELTQELQYDVPVSVARCEARLLQGDRDEAASELEAAHSKATAMDAGPLLATTALWMWRSGQLDRVPRLPDGPESLSLAGRAREAAELWTSIGRPYDAAWALLDSDDRLDIGEARARFDRFGATRVVALCDEKLRSIGAPVPRGARASTRRNLGGLTDREVEVLGLLSEGLRNSDIAASLHLSEKTVGHHVSAILAKLGASSRTEAVRRARELAAAV